MIFNIKIRGKFHKLINLLFCANFNTIKNARNKWIINLIKCFLIFVLNFNTSSEFIKCYKNSKPVCEFKTKSTK